MRHKFKILLILLLIVTLAFLSFTLPGCETEVQEEEPVEETDENDKEVEEDDTDEENEIDLRDRG